MEKRVAATFVEVQLKELERLNLEKSSFSHSTNKYV